MVKKKVSKKPVNPNRRKERKIRFSTGEIADIDSRRGVLPFATFVRVQALRKD